MGTTVKDLMKVKPMSPKDKKKAVDFENKLSNRSSFEAYQISQTPPLKRKP